MNILAIDPGTKCGWAMQTGEGTFSGCWDLKPTRFEGGGMRFLRLRQMVAKAMGIGDVKQVVFEEVRRHAGTDAAHIYGGIVAIITALCEEQGIPYSGVPVATVKRQATGKGNADKPAMLAAARIRWPAQDVADDNQADALWILDCALEGKV